MGFTFIIMLIVLALICVMIKLVIDGIQDKNWKKVVVTIIAFSLVLILIYYALVSFITSM